MSETRPRIFNNEGDRTMDLCSPTTKELAERIQRDGSEAYETMTPGQILRVEYALALRQLAAVMKADPTGGTGMDIYGLLENALEQRVNALVQVEVHRQYDRGFRDGKAEADSGRIVSMTAVGPDC